MVRKGAADERGFLRKGAARQLDRAKICGSHLQRCFFTGDAPMRKLFLVAALASFAAGSAFAQDSCETKAVGKDGKPLAGAAKTSFMKKCMADDCAAKAVGSDGKKLAGAAKTSFMKKCEAGG
jgi:hypothetical protein